MKKIIVFFAVMIICLSSIAQNSFTRDSIIDVNKTKDQLYVETKMFIADSWKSAQDVTQLDDQESGTIIIKGITTLPIPYMIAAAEAVYDYTVKFSIKDNKCRIQIYNIAFRRVISAYPNWHNYEYHPLPEYPGRKVVAIKEEHWQKLMVNIKSEILPIVDLYATSIVKTEKTDW